MANIPKNISDMDRKTASKILGVTIRTIDRYIKRGRLSARQENGRIRLDKTEVMNFNPAVPAKNRMSIDRPISTGDVHFYRELYEEAKRALFEYRQKLEQANYRIGQLESQTAHPIGDKSFERREDFFSIELLKKDIQERKKELYLLKEAMKRERASRIIFAIITYILIILLPVFWYLTR